MRGATMSLVRAWLIGIGAFTVVTAAFCLALTIAIAGPPSPSEIAGFQVATADALRELDAAGQRVRGKLCTYLPREQREAASCETDVAQAEAPSPVAEAPPRVIVADVDTAPPATVTPIAASEDVPIVTPPRQATHVAASRRAHAARRTPARHRARPSANSARRIVLAGANRRPPPARRPAPPAAVAPPASTPHPLPEIAAPPPQAPSAEPAAVSAGDADDLRGEGHAHASVADEILEDEPPPDSEDAPPDDLPPDELPPEPEPEAKK